MNLWLYFSHRNLHSFSFCARQYFLHILFVLKPYSVILSPAFSHIFCFICWLDEIQHRLSVAQDVQMQTG